MGLEISSDWLPASDQLKAYEVHLIKWTVAIYLFLSIQIWLPVAFFVVSSQSDLWTLTSTLFCMQLLRAGYSLFLGPFSANLRDGWDVVRIPKYFRRTFDRELSSSPRSMEKRPSYCSADATSPLLSEWVIPTNRWMEGKRSSLLRRCATRPSSRLASWFRLFCRLICSSTSARGIRTNSALNGSGARLKNHQITKGNQELELCNLDSNCVPQFWFFYSFIYLFLKFQVMSDELDYLPVHLCLKQTDWIFSCHDDNTTSDWVT